MASREGRVARHRGKVLLALFDEEALVERLLPEGDRGVAILVVIGVSESLRALNRLLLALLREVRLQLLPLPGLRRHRWVSLGHEVLLVLQVGRVVLVVFISLVVLLAAAVFLGRVERVLVVSDLDFFLSIDVRDVGGWRRQILFVLLVCLWRL